MDLSIVIVNYNVKHFLKECLLSIQSSRQIQNYTYEVWVVDNASIDRSVDMLQEEFPEVKIIANSENLGFSKANNQAIRQAGGKYILLLNPDTLLSENTLSICIESMNSDPKIGALGVKMIDGSGHFLTESKRGLPSVWNSFCKLSGLSSTFPKTKVFNGYTLSHLPENEAADIDVLCGAFMFIPKTVFDEVGLLDERFFMYGEDIDLSYRIQKEGYTIRYLPSTNIIHFKGESTKKGSFSYVRIFYEAMILYVKKHYTGSGSLIFVLGLKMAILFRAGLSLIKRGLHAIITPALDFMLLFCLGFIFKNLWATYRFKDVAYYDETPILINISGAAIIIILGLYLAGGYRKLSSIKRHFWGIFSGSLLVLAIYGLLEGQWRNSRAILLLMSLGSYLIIPFFHLILSRYFSSVKKKKVLLIGGYENSEKIRNSIASLKNNTIEVIGLMHPNPSINTHEYINSIDQLEEVIQVLKVNEIIFSKKDLSMEQIMSIMSSIKSSVDFKISGDDLLTFIGSKNKNEKGEIYSLDITYNLNKKDVIRQKRVLDIFLSILALLISPISFILKGFSAKVWTNPMDVLRNKKRWVGYTNALQHQLPDLGKSVIHLKDESDFLSYARDYSIGMDLLPFFKYLYTK